MTERIEAARKYIREKFGDFPQPEKSCIVLSNPRSGSNLLLRHLEEVGYGKPIEAFHWNANRIRREQGWTINFDDPFEYISHAIEYQTVNGICGMKLGWHHFQYYLSVVKQLFVDYPEALSNWELIEVFFPNPVYLHLMRKNKVKQAVSLSKSKQTGIWYVSVDDDEDYDDYVAPPVYDREHIEYCFGEVLSKDVQWITLLALDQIPHLRIWYEDYVKDVDEEMRKIDRYLGGTGDLVVPALPLKKLANRRSVDWYERFQQETEWLHEPLVERALRESEFPLLLAYYADQVVTRFELQQYAQLPSVRFRKLRRFFHRGIRKLKQILSIS